MIYLLPAQRRGTLARLVVLVTLAFVVFAPAARAADAPGKHALLVGCTKYALPGIVELYGPGNDVPRVRDLLVQRFGFPEGEIRTLVGGMDDPAEKRPSYANIAAAFKDLIERTRAGDQVVILLSGHGTRLPIAQPKAADNWKANHLAFLPVDVRAWQADRIENALLDDELKGWLEQLRARQATILIVFDCCHSGSMTRGVERSREVSRTVRPQDLGIPDAAILSAVGKAQQGALQAPPPGARARGADLMPTGLGLRGTAKDKEKEPGSLTAFYACQPWEETPELPRPEGVAQVRENYYGLLTYTLVEVLSVRDGKLTYRELGQALTLKYKVDRGTRGPTPFYEGDLDREVLGSARLPNRSAIVLQKEEGKLRVTAGELQGVTPESVLAVHPVPGGKADPLPVLGYVRVTKVGPSWAEVEPCPRGDARAVAPDTLPEGGVCRVVERGLGRFRIKLAVARPRPEEEKANPEVYAARVQRCATLDAVLKDLAKEEDVKELFEVIADEAAADWVLGVEPLFQPRVQTDDRVVLWQGLGQPLDARTLRAIDYQSTDPVLKNLPKPRRIYGGYRAEDRDAIRDGLLADLERIHTWRNLWRIAGGAGAAADPAQAEGLQLEILRKDTKDGPTVGQLRSGEVVRSGQYTEMRLTNKGSEGLYVALIFLDADFRIDVYHLSLSEGETRKLPGQVESKVAGQDGVIVLAVPMANKSEPRYDFLKQFPLAEVARPRGANVPKPSAERGTPLQEALKTARMGKGTREWVMDQPEAPRVLSWSWNIVVEPGPR